MPDTAGGEEDIRMKGGRRRKQPDELHRVQAPQVVIAEINPHDEVVRLDDLIARLPYQAPGGKLGDEFAAGYLRSLPGNAHQVRLTGKRLPVRFLAQQKGVQNVVHYLPSRPSRPPSR